MTCKTSEANRGTPPVVNPILTGSPDELETTVKPLTITVKLIDPVPPTKILGLLSVSPWSADKVCPDVTGKLPVAFVNGIFPESSLNNVISTPVVALFVKITL